MINLRRAGEPHAVSAALSTTDERAFVTFDGVNTRLEPRLARAVAASRATHVHLAFYPRHCAAWAGRVRRLRARGVTSSWDFGWNDVLARDPDLPALIDALDIVFLNDREASLYGGRRPSLLARAPGAHRDQARSRRQPRHLARRRALGARAEGDARGHDRRRRRVQRRVSRAPDRRRHARRLPARRQSRRGRLDAESRRHRRAATLARTAVKVAIIGGAGVRVPLLVRGLAQAGLGIGEIALFDIDAPRLAVIADLAPRRRQRDPQRARPAGACIEGAGFVITSIRVGGARQRARDEATALAHGVVAQETVGAVGFAMAVRTIPAMVEYARLSMRLAPRAWLVTFTNPVSVVTQAVRQETGARAIGICDTPYEIFEDAAHALGLPATECAYDYFGLNHLGWLREVYHRGVPQMDRLWNDRRALKSAYRGLAVRERRGCANCGCCRASISTTTTGPRPRSNICGARARAAACMWPA